MKYFPLFAVALSFLPCLSAEADLTYARSVSCSAFPGLAIVSLRRSNQFTGSFSGLATNGFYSVNFDSCSEATDEIQCDGQWIGNGGLAHFTMTIRDDGTYEGWLTGVAVVPKIGPNPMNCLPSTNGPTE